VAATLAADPAAKATVATVALAALAVALAVEAAKAARHLCSSGTLRSRSRRSRGRAAA
jgi:hypothetical protein